VQVVNYDNEKVDIAMIDPGAFEASFLFNIIGENNRLKVLTCLMEKAQTVGEIREETKIEKTLLSKHLKALRSAGIVFSTRTGRNLKYQINPRLRKPGHRRSIFLHCCEIKLRPAR